MECLNLLRKDSKSDESGEGYCPSLETIFIEVLCPNMPLKKAGIRIEPPISEPEIIRYY
jgi:hypothetical protein